MTIELKPCPFCGSDHLFISTNTLNQIEYMNCAQCGARHPADKWNTRAESAEVERLRARIAELEATLAAELETPSYRSDGLAVSFADDDLMLYVTTSTGSTKPPPKGPEES